MCYRIKPHHTWAPSRKLVFHPRQVAIPSWGSWLFCGMPLYLSVFCELLTDHMPWILICLEFDTSQFRKFKKSPCTRWTEGVRQMAKLCITCLSLAFQIVVPLALHARHPQLANVHSSFRSQRCVGWGSPCWPTRSSWAPSAWLHFILISHSSLSPVVAGPCVSHSLRTAAWPLPCTHWGQEGEKDPVWLDTQWPGLGKSKGNNFFTFWAWNANTTWRCPACKRSPRIRIRSVGPIGGEVRGFWSLFLCCTFSTNLRLLLTCIVAYLQSWDYKSYFDFLPRF